MSVLGGYELHCLQLPAALAPQLTQGQVVGIFQAKHHGRFCPPFLRCLPPRNEGLAAFHPQPGGPNISPGLSVLELSIPLGRGSAQRGDGPEGPKDKLSSPHLSPREAVPHADPRQGSSRPAGTDPQPVPRGDPIAVLEPDATAAPRHPAAAPGDVCALMCYVCIRAGQAGPR